MCFIGAQRSAPATGRQSLPARGGFEFHSPYGEPSALGLVVIVYHQLFAEPGYCNCRRGVAQSGLERCVRDAEVGAGHRPVKFEFYSPHGEPARPDHPPSPSKASGIGGLWRVGRPAKL